MGQQQSPQERNKQNRDLLNTEFSFKYTESGGLTNRYLLISYNSKTNVITSSTDISGSNIIEDNNTPNIIKDFTNDTKGRKCGNYKQYGHYTKTCQNI